MQKLWPPIFRRRLSIWRKKMRPLWDSKKKSIFDTAIYLNRLMDFLILFVSNPPYIAAEEYEKLPAGVKNYEPQDALLAGKSGLEFYEKLIYQAGGFLKKNGWLLLEIGAKQEAGVRKITEAAGFYDNIEMRRDYAGLPRVIKARRKVSG